MCVLPMSLSVVILLLRRGAIADSLDTDGKVLLYMYMYMHTCTMYNYTCTCIYCTCTIIYTLDMYIVYYVDVFRLCLWFLLFFAWALYNHTIACIYTPVHVHVCMCIMTMKNPTFTHLNLLDNEYLYIQVLCMEQ